MRDDNEALRRKIKPGGLGISKIWYEIKARAKVAYRLWMHSPRHPLLQFKKTGTVRGLLILLYFDCRRKNAALSGTENSTSMSPCALTKVC